MKKLYLKTIFSNVRAVIAMTLTCIVGFVQAQNITVDQLSDPSNGGLNYYPYETITVDYSTDHSWPTGTQFYLVLDDDGTFDSDDYILDTETAASGQLSGTLPNDPDSYNLLIVAGNNGTIGDYIMTSTVSVVSLTAGGTASVAYPLNMNEAAFRFVESLSDDYDDGDNYTLFFDLIADNVLPANPLVVEYTLDGGANYVTMSDVEGNSSFSAISDTLVFKVPTAALTTGVQFRVSQTGSDALALDEQDWQVNSIISQNTDGTFIEYGKINNGVFTITSPTITINSTTYGDYVGEDFSVDYRALGFTTGSRFYLYTGNILDPEDRIIFASSNTMSSVFESSWPYFDTNMPLRIGGYYGNLEDIEYDYSAEELVTTGTSNTDFNYYFGAAGVRNIRTAITDLAGENYATLEISISSNGNNLSVDDALLVQYSLNGTTWVGMDTLTGNFNTTYTYDLSGAQLAATTRFRIRQNSITLAADDMDWTLFDMNVVLYDEQYDAALGNPNPSNYSIVVQEIVNSDDEVITEAYPGDEITVLAFAYGFDVDPDSLNFAVVIGDSYVLTDQVVTRHDNDVQDSVKITGKIPANIEYTAGMDVEVKLHSGAAALIGFDVDLFDDYDAEDEDSGIVIVGGMYDSGDMDVLFTSAGDRSLTLPALNIPTNVGLTFEFTLERDLDVRSPSGTEIVLEYSTDGTTYTELDTYNLNDAGSMGTTYELDETTLVSGVASTGTYFRFRQVSNNGEDLDGWLISDIILANGTTILQYDYVEYDGDLLDVNEPVIELTAIDNNAADYYPGDDLSITFTVTGEFPANTTYSVYLDWELDKLLSFGDFTAAGTHTVKVPAVISDTYSIFIQASHEDVESNTVNLAVSNVSIFNVEITSTESTTDGDYEFIYPSNEITVSYETEGTIGSGVLAYLEVYDNNTDEYVILEDSVTVGADIVTDLPLGLDYNGVPDFRLRLEDMSNNSVYGVSIDESWINNTTISDEYFPLIDRVGHISFNQFWNNNSERSATSIPLNFTDGGRIDFDISLNSFTTVQTVYFEYSTDEGETWEEIISVEVNAGGVDIFPMTDMPEEAWTDNVLVRFIYNEDGLVSGVDNWAYFSGFEVQNYTTEPISEVEFDLSEVSNLNLELLSVSMATLTDTDFNLGEEFVVEYNADGPFGSDVEFAVVMNETVSGDYMVLDQSASTGAVQLTVSAPMMPFGDANPNYEIAVYPFVKETATDTYRAATEEEELAEEADFESFTGRNPSEMGFSSFEFNQTGDRSLETRDVAISGFGPITLSFDYTFSGSYSTSLVLPLLEVSTDGGATFEIIEVTDATYAENGMIYPSGSYTVELDEAYYTDATRFRFRQPLNGGAGVHVWEVSNIVVSKGETNIFDPAAYTAVNMDQSISLNIPDLDDYVWEPADVTDAVFNGEDFEFVWTIDSTALETSTFPEGTSFTFTIDVIDPDTGEELIIGTADGLGTFTGTIPNWVENGNYDVMVYAEYTVDDEIVEFDFGSNVVATLDVFLRAIEAVYLGDENAILYAGSTVSFSVGVQNDETNAGTYDALFANLIADDGDNRWVIDAHQGIGDLSGDLPTFINPANGYSDLTFTVELSENEALGAIGEALESNDGLVNIENGFYGDDEGIANFLNVLDYANIEYNFAGTDDDQFDNNRITFANVSGRRVITTRDFTADELASRLLISFDLSFDKLPTDLTTSQYLVFEYSTDGGASYTEFGSFPDADAEETLVNETIRFTLPDAVKEGARFRWRQDEKNGNIVLDNISFTTAEALPFDYIGKTINLSNQALIITSVGSEESCFDGSVTLNYEVRGRFGAENLVYVEIAEEATSTFTTVDQAGSTSIVEGTGSITFDLPSDLLDDSDDNTWFQFRLYADDITNEDFNFDLTGQRSEQLVEVVAPINQSLSFSWDDPLECNLTDVTIYLSGVQNYFMYEAINTADNSVLASLTYDPEVGDTEINIGTITEDMNVAIRTSSMTSAGTSCNTLMIEGSEEMIEIQPTYKLYRRGFNDVNVKVLVNAGDSRIICGSSTEVRLSVNRTASSSDASTAIVEWFRDDFSNPVSISGSLLGDNEQLVSGSYFARVTDDNGVTSCTYVTESFTITREETPEKPEVTVVSGDLTFCDGEGEVVLAAPEGYTYYKWNGNILWTSRTLTVEDAGSYYVEVSNVPFDAGCGSATSDPIIIESQYLPDFQVKWTNTSDDGYNVIHGSSFTACESFRLYFYDGNSNANNNGEVVIYKDSVFFASTQGTYFDLLDSGLYRVDWVSSNLNSSCTATIGYFSLDVTEQPETPSITVTGATEFCEGGTVTLTADAGYNYYRWYRDGNRLSASSRTLTVTQNSGRYQVEASNVPFNVGCFSERSEGVRVTVYAEPDLDIYSNNIGSLNEGQVVDYCESDGDWHYLRAYNNSNGQGNPMTWYLDGVEIAAEDNAQGSTDFYSYIYPKQSGVYHAEVTIGGVNASAQCTFMTNAVTVNYISELAPVTIATPTVTDFCADEVSVTLTADAGAPLYRWYRNGSAITDGTGSANTLTVAQAGSYQVTVANERGCESELSNVIEITSTALPSTSINLTEVSTDCASGDLTVIASGTNSKYNYQLFDTETRANIGSVFTGNSSGNVYLTISGLTTNTLVGVEVSYADGTGCTNSVDYFDQLRPNSVVLELDGNSLQAMIYGDYLEYTWYRNGVKMRGVTGTSLTITDAATYSIEVLFEGGCMLTSNSIGLTPEEAARTSYVKPGSIVAVTYPNPTTEVVNIDIPGDNLGEYKVQISTLSGQIVYAESFNKDQETFVKTIDVSSVKAGIYNMTVIKGEKVDNIRIIKQ